MLEGLPVVDSRKGRSASATSRRKGAPAFESRKVAGLAGIRLRGRHVETAEIDVCRGALRERGLRAARLADQIADGRRREVFLHDDAEILEVALRQNEFDGVALDVAGADEITRRVDVFAD